VRALIQRVSRASVSVDGRQISSIGPGLLVLLGIARDDSEARADWLADKVRALRVFPDAEGRMNEPLGEREVLCVSQFTLYGDARRGNRPSYVGAAEPERAEAHREALDAAEAVLAARHGRRAVDDVEEHLGEGEGEEREVDAALAHEEEADRRANQEQSHARNRRQTPYPNSGPGS